MIENASRSAAEATAGSAIQIAYRFLGRWSDGFTRSFRHELAHESAIVAWDRQHTLRDPHKFAAFVRTIARRLRSQAARRSLRRDEVSIHAEDHLWEQLAEQRAERVLLPVRGRQVDREVLLRHLDGALEMLTRLNRRLLLSYYEGFSCAELAARFGLTEDTVKVRVHRARSRLRRVFEQRVRSLNEECGTDS